MFIRNSVHKSVKTFVCCLAVLCIQWRVTVCKLQIAVVIVFYKRLAPNAPAYRLLYTVAQSSGGQPRHAGRILTDSHGATHVHLDAWTAKFHFIRERIKFITVALCLASRISSRGVVTLSRHHETGVPTSVKLIVGLKQAWNRHPHTLNALILTHQLIVRRKGLIWRS